MSFGVYVCLPVVLVVVFRYISSKMNGDIVEF